MVIASVVLIVGIALLARSVLQVDLVTRSVCQSPAGSNFSVRSLGRHGREYGSHGNARLAPGTQGLIVTATPGAVALTCTS